MLVNAESAPPELSGVDVECVPATRLAAGLGSGFVNIVMLGAVASALGEPTLEHLQDAAVEALGGKTASDDLHRALAEGYAWRT